MAVRALDVPPNRRLARDAAVPVEGADVAGVVDRLADLVVLGPSGTASRAREQVMFDRSFYGHLDLRSLAVAFLPAVVPSRAAPSQPATIRPGVLAAPGRTGLEA